jgi:hypothetical protein
MGMLQIAKTRAMRDQAIRGVRLIPSTTPAGNLAGTWITDLQYIEQPPEYSAGVITNLGPQTGAGLAGTTDYNLVTQQPLPNPLLPATRINGSMVFFGPDPNNASNAPDFFGGFGYIPNDTSKWAVQDGDYLEVGGSGMVYRINKVRYLGPNAVNPAATGTILTVSLVNTVLSQPAAKNTNPAIIFVRNAQTIAAGATLVIDTGTNQETARVLNVLSAPKGMIQLAQPLAFAHAVNKQVTSNPVPQFPANAPYRIIRQPRPSGEDVLQMPLNVAIDTFVLNSAAALQYAALNPNWAGTPGEVTIMKTKRNTAYDPPMDILFGPSGAVVGVGAANDKIVLWVHDTTQPKATDNYPILVSVYTRSGLISAQPVDVVLVNGAPNYYSFTVDGKSSGQ